ncbi:MAG TPA: hypothetical protein VKB34_03040, partial [Povalibacter sp.]|nr:hypothetical protein [Povalibacter sp.]
SGLVLQINAANDYAVPAGSTFTFPSSTTLGGSNFYSIHIKQQPAGKTCTITNAIGVVGINLPNPNNAAVTCVDSGANGLSGTYRPVMVNGESFTDGRAFLTFNPDGTYIFGIHSSDPDCGASNGDGLEYGAYRWNQTTHAFVFANVVLDTNGDCGMANDGDPGAGGTLVRNGDGTLSTDTLDTNGSGDHVLITWAPVPSNAGELVGSWGDNQVFFVYSSQGTVFSADTRANAVLTAGAPGIEDGCYALSGTLASGSYVIDLSGTCAVNGQQTAVDTTGTNGFSAWGSGAWPFTVTGDSMQRTLPGTAFSFTELRIKPN